MKSRTEEIKNVLLGLFGERRSWERKPLLLECLCKLGYTDEQIKNKETGSPATREKGRIGSVLSQMCANEDITQDESGLLTLCKETKIIIRESEAEEFISGLFSGGDSHTKRGIYDLTEAHFNVNKTKTRVDDNELRSLSGQIISRLTREKTIARDKNGVYSAVINSRFPNTEIGNCLNDAYNGADLYKCFIHAVNLKGGEFFENFSVGLLQKYFLAVNKSVERSDVTGGSDDNGIDGVIETTDRLGYREKILIQAKNRKSIAVSTKEIREFYGALCAENGTRGIFITTSSFHSDALRLINRIGNLIGIDGKKLFSLSNESGYGIKDENGRKILDEKIFLD